jgi:hypothetical protein
MIRKAFLRACSRGISSFDFWSFYVLYQFAAWDSVYGRLGIEWKSCFMAMGCHHPARDVLFMHAYMHCEVSN